VPPLPSASVIVIVISPRKCRVIRLELVHLDDLLILQEPHEAAVVSVRVGSCLAGLSWRIVRERDPERAAFAGVERMYMHVMPSGTFHLATARGSSRAR